MDSVNVIENPETPLVIINAFYSMAAGYTHYLTDSKR